jgi:predicted tellurium resistance membrane protein TerC
MTKTQLRLLTRHSWIAYLGLLGIVFVSVDMIAHGGKEVLQDV